ncbi:MAG: amino acid adenylation domain-containing protein [Flavobacteriales bacterium]|nr:amino acid adenylation domain-containing protein [Flavobacteriales bacterium]
MSTRHEHLWDLFHASFTAGPERTALVTTEGAFTYAELCATALAISARIRKAGPVGPFIGLFAERGFAAYAGMLGILHAGRAYVPINTEMPAKRRADIRDQAGLSMFITDIGRADLARTSLPGTATLVVAVDNTDARITVDGTPVPPQAGTDPPISGGPAYLLFTSGSTGTPKGVPVSHRSVATYIRHMRQLFRVRPDDRFSQLFALTFDLSVHDLFMAWASGASLHVVPEDQRLAPASFIRDQGITCWFAVPSSALVMQRLRLLRANAFPSLRVSAFCGEPLPMDLAQAWMQAAPKSRLLNLYGPTEATIAITAYEATTGSIAQDQGIVSIGHALPEAEAVIEEDTGELLLGGPQLAEGYWQDAPRTAERFITRNGRRLYRTGDRVHRDANGYLYFDGRLDDQVKVRGHRVELREVELVLQRHSAATFVHVLAHPLRDGLATGLVAVLPDDHAAREQELLKACATELPDYMVPSRILFLKALPLSSSGKVDRRALRALLDPGTDQRP